MTVTGWQVCRSHPLQGRKHEDWRRPGPLHPMKSASLGPLLPGSGIGGGLGGGPGPLCVPWGGSQAKLHKEASRLL